MIRVMRKPGDRPLPPIEVDFGDGGSIPASLSQCRNHEPMSKKSFIPPKPILTPLSDENLVSYGDRLLWHQLGLQLNGWQQEMLTEDEFVATVRGFYPEALEHNVRSYRNYFNSRQSTMRFREIELPVPVQFAEGTDE
jgi:hypothetical protein